MNKLEGIDTCDFFSHFFSNAQGAGIMILTTKGHVLYSNHIIETSFGYSQDDLIGKYFSLMFIPEDILKKLPEIEIINVLQKGSWLDNNYVQHKNGEHIWAYGESVLVRNKHGEPYIIKVIFDINQQKILERFLIASEQHILAKNKELERINKDLDTFVYTASHDLKAPIANMEGLLGALEYSISNNESTDEIIGLMNEAISKFKGMLNDLSAVAKNKEEESDICTINFKEMTEDVLYFLNESVRKNNVSIRYNFSKAPELKYSRKNLRSILHNLISNAIKYHSPDRKPEVMIETDIIPGYLVLSVKDNGLGINDEDKDRVFQMYTRVHDHVEGSGVGVAMINNIIKNNGGKFELESEIGKGSIFKVFFRVP